MSLPSPISSGLILHWTIDEETARAATEQQLPMLPDKQNQARGTRTSIHTWNARVAQPATWKDPLDSHPETIIKQFADGRYTQGLALTVSWGGMARQSARIYRDGSRGTIEKIENTLLSCASNIRKTDSIEQSWNALTDAQSLGWSGVMASKVLHFLCRSMGYTQNPPVPVDGEVVRKRLWPLFRYSRPFDRRLADWEGDSFEAYNRYMTAICTWATQRHWSTGAMEATIYAHFARR